MKLFEIFGISDDSFIEKYLYGKCHIFALALNEKFGYPIQAIWDLDAQYENKNGKLIPGQPGLIHMYVIANGYPMDASGDTSIEKAMGHGEAYNPEITNMTKQEVLDLINKNILDKPMTNEIKNLIKYIENNIENYS